MKVNEIITQEVIKNLEKSGKWFKNWQDLYNFNIDTPKRGYTGINTLLLAMSRAEQGFQSPIWLTYNQINKKGGTIKEDQSKKYTKVIFCKTFKTEKKKATTKTNPKGGFMMRYYRLYNLDQINGIEFDLDLIGKDNKELTKPSEIARKYIKREGITLNDGIGSVASYSPLTDTISMPDFNTFNTSEDYYRVLFHEIIHSTGNKTRLNRNEDKTNFNSKIDYSKEELVAELGSLFLSGHAEIEPSIKNSSAYIRGWIKVLKNDPQMIITASSKAQKAFELVISIKKED